MNKIDDFENAPTGATATYIDGRRAIKMGDVGGTWITTNELWCSNEQVWGWGYTLDAPVPTTAREALDLAWELAHPIREGQFIPAGTDYLVSRNGERPATMRANLDQLASKSDEANRRTLEPLPEPDWLDAPAVLATVKDWDSSRDRQAFTRLPDGRWAGRDGNWETWDLTDVTPLYPLNEGTLNGTTAPKGYTPSNSMGSKNEETES